MSAEAARPVRFAARILDALASVVAPRQCVACDADRAGAAEQSTTMPLCPACAASLDPSTLGHRESVGCATGVRVVAVLPYVAPWSLAIRRFKYQGRTDLAAPLAHELGRALTDANVAADVVVPVPLHRTRLVERGYNQAALLAWVVSRMLSLRCDPRALARVRDTGSLALLGGRERPAAVADAFSAESRLVAGRGVLLIDDVVTTGATIGECRRAIDRAGGRVVAVGALATASGTGPVAGLHEM